MGREFIEMFDEWADTYDLTVKGDDEEYKEVFENYDHILEEVARRAEGTVVEFGVGTGNLTKHLLKRNLKVYGIEPSARMRGKAKHKFPHLELYEGDFLNFPLLDRRVDTIVSSYAFHHLTDEEKDRAIALYGQWLPEGGKIIFADTLFENESEKRNILDRVKQQGYSRLLHDLETEYYPLKATLADLYAKNGFTVQFTPLNRYVWLTEAEKRKKNG